MAFSAQQKVVLSILAYSFCSGTLVLLNKLTLHYVPFPSLVVAFQLSVCIALIYGANFMGKIDVDPIRWEFVKPYLLYITFFAVGIYCNMRSLSISNVETVIVFRALCPLLVTFLDAFFMGREWPSLRSWTGLSIIVVGAYGYATYDEKFRTQGYSAYFWPTLYMFVIAMEMAYGKKIVKSVPLQTLSGPVIYTNILGFFPMLMFAAMGGEYDKFWAFWWSSSDYRLPPECIPYLILGCLVGTGIGYSSWWCRSLVSATSFTLIGVMNKCLTIMLNLVMWDQHASTGGLFCLMLCIGGGLIYQQAPMKSESSSKGIISESGEEEINLLENGGSSLSKAQQ